MHCRRAAKHCARLRGKRVFGLRHGQGCRSKKRCQMGGWEKGINSSGATHCPWRPMCWRASSILRLPVAPGSATSPTHAQRLVVPGRGTGVVLAPGCGMGHGAEHACPVGVRSAWHGHCKPPATAGFTGAFRPWQPIRQPRATALLARHGLVCSMSRNLQNPLSDCLKKLDHDTACSTVLTPFMAVRLNLLEPIAALISLKEPTRQRIFPWMPTEFIAVFSTKLLWAVQRRLWNITLAGDVAVN